MTKYQKCECNIQTCEQKETKVLHNTIFFFLLLRTQNSLYQKFSFGVGSMKISIMFQWSK